MFDFSLRKLDGLIDARVSRNEETEEARKRMNRDEKKGGEKKPGARPGTMKDLKLLFG